MRSIVFLILIGPVVTGCKNPAAEVTAAKVEPASERSPDGDREANGLTALTINPSNSKIEFVGAKVTASHPGGFTDFTGTVDLGQPVEASRIEVTIETASLYVDKEKLTKHLKSPDFFDVGRFPTATFRSVEIKAADDGYTITGDLTLHGITKRISFPASIAATDKQVSANAEFSINRQDFGIAYPGMPDDLIRDLVVVKLSLTIPRQS